MTRYSGKPLKVSSVEDLLQESTHGIKPNNTIRYRIYKYIQKLDKPFLVNDIHKAVSPVSSRRVIERALTDLTVKGMLSRKKCICGCSYIYVR